MSGNVGMSSELQAIMQRRLAKCSDEQSIVSISSSIKSAKDDVKVESVDSKNIIQNAPTKVAPRAETPKVFSRFKENKSRSLAQGDYNDTGCTIVATEKGSDQKSNISDFKRNIAKFDQNQKSTPNPNLNRNVRTPVESWRTSPIPFDESPKAPYSDSKIASTSVSRDPNNIMVKPYALRPSSTKKLSSAWAGSTHTQNRNVGKDEVAMTKNANDRKIPKVVVTQTPPPPPPPKGSPSNERQQQKSLPPSHVQAMKLKFLLKNPEPQHVVSSSPTPTPVVPVSSTSNNMREIVKEETYQPIDNQAAEETHVLDVQKEVKEILEMEINDGLDESSTESDFHEVVQVEEPTSFFAAFDVPKLENELDHKNENNGEDTTFAAKFDKDAMDVVTEDNFGAGSAQEQNLFETFDPAFDAKEQDFATTHAHAGGDWNWNGSIPQTDDLDVESSVHNVKHNVEHLDCYGHGAYVPPPMIGFTDFGDAAPFIPENDDFEDDDDRETLMESTVDAAALNDITIRRSDLLTFANSDDSRSFSCQNPLTNNVILCRKQGKRWVINEFHTSTGPIAICTTEISCPEIQRKLDGVRVCGVKEIEGVTAGLHYNNGQARVSIGVLLSLYAFGVSEPLKMIAVWNWGYGEGRLNSLNTVFPSPLPKFACDRSTLSIADRCVFMAGVVDSKAAIFISKLHENQEWIPSVVNMDSASATDPDKIICMEVHTEGKVIAISTEMGGISIYSYSELISSRTEAYDKQQIKLLCILQGVSAFDRAPTSIFSTTVHLDLHETSAKDKSSRGNERTDKSSYLSNGKCHCIAWLSKDLSSSSLTSSSPLVLVASFALGVVVYSLSLPLTVTNERHETPSLSELAGSSALDAPQSKINDPIVISPFTASRFDGGKADNSTVLWMKGENGSFPYLAIVLFRKEGEMMMNVAKISFPMRGEDKTTSIITVFEETFPFRGTEDCYLYGRSLAGGLVAHRHGQLTSFHLASKLRNSSDFSLHPKLHLDSMPIISETLGLTDYGHFHQPFNDVIYVHTSIELGSGFKTTPLITPSNQIGLQPFRRYSLHKTTTGDANIVCREDAGADFPKGGANTSFLCDLNYENSSSVAYSPRRITMDPFGKRCVILFGEVREDVATVFASFDLPTEGNQLSAAFDLRPGKDALFIPGVEDILVLDNAGKALRVCATTNLNTDLKTDGLTVKIFEEGSSNDQKLVVDRIFTVSKSITFLCSRKADGKQCLFIGGRLESLKSSSSKAFVRKKTSKLWFERCELFVSLTELPSDNGSESTNIAIATTSRVMIVSFGTTLQVLTQTESKLSCRSLAPLGSNSVAFIDTSNDDHHLTYLCSYERNQEGIICNLVDSRPGESFAMLALRPDRVVYLPINSHFTTYTPQIEAGMRDIALPLTKPLLLFEPLIANALARDGSSDSKDILLQRILERFGPKKTGNPYSENEGLGTAGAGITVKAFTMLSRKLGINLNAGENHKRIACWVPQKLRGDVLNGSNLKTTSENLLTEITNQLKDADGEGSDDVWASIDETKHAWYAGPFDNKEELLLLDSIDEWFGKSCPNIVGKVGAELAAETGESALQSILAAAAAGGIPDEENDDANDSAEPIVDGWIPNIGEGRKDEDNLSLYLRFSEGIGGSWRENGIGDLSVHRNKIELLHPDSISIEETTSNVDEGEPGKVRPLYDIVLKKDEETGGVGCFMTKVPRGGALDVGMFHSDLNIQRQRATLEFWFFIPEIPSEIVLARRSIYQSEEDWKDQCSVDEKGGLLWELVALPSGHLEFRNRIGAVLTSEVVTGKDKSAFDFDLDDNDETKGQLSLPLENGYGGWNHVCLSFSCKDLAPTTCNISLRMRGSLIGSTDFFVDIPGLDGNKMLDFQAIDSALKHTSLAFGLGGIDGLRFTEIRLWACKRASDDIKMMMYEHLDIAKTKKKLKLSIRSFGLTKETKNGLLMPPRSVDKAKSTVLERPPLRLPGIARRLVQDDDDSTFNSFADFGSVASANEEDEHDSNTNPYIAEYYQRHDVIVQSDETNADMGFADLGTPSDELGQGITPPASAVISSIHSSLISEGMRKSAAAALIRGPPACRHFGGNRGGLPFSYESSIHGNICVTGSEKTIIFSASNGGRTYPIGASGAIISDRIDGTEYLCCFLAKDKRIVVFDLVSKVVVVELQMTTKLNYWRFLPPQAHGNTLVFLLVTPIGAFHWMPLEDSPRPKQVWRRGRGLQRKKIVSYEEGGSNGLPDSECRSAIALILATSSSPDDLIEAWCHSIGGGSTPLCISENVLGAALVNPGSSSADSFLPMVAIIAPNNAWEKEMTLALHAVQINRESDTMTVEDIIAEVVISQNSNDQEIDEPIMAMGTAPPALCLSCQDFIVVILRNVGYIVIYKFINRTLDLVHETKLERYIVDASIKAQPGIDGIEAIMLTCEPEDMKDGRIVTIHVS